MAFTILTIDGSEAVKNGIREALSTAGLVSVFLEASNGMEGFKVLLNDPIDLVLCDLGMRGIDGHQFLSMLQLVIICLLEHDIKV